MKKRYLIGLVAAFPIGLLSVLVGPSLALQTLGSTASIFVGESDDDWQNNCDHVMRNQDAWSPPEFRQFLCLKEDGSWTAINVYSSEDLKHGDVALSGPDGGDSIIDEGPNWIEQRLTEEEQQLIENTLDRQAVDPCLSGDNPECAH